MFCPTCGSRIPDDARFCGVCGVKINRPGAAPVPPAQPAPAQPGSVRPTAPVPAPFSAPGVRMPASVRLAAPGSTYELIRLVPLASGVLALVALVLPMFGVGFLGFSGSMNGINMVFGGEVLGYSIDGDPFNLLLLVPGVLGLVSALVLHGRVARVAAIVGGAFGLLLVMALGSSVVDSSVGELQIGFWLFALASIALLASSVAGIVLDKRA